MTKLQQLNKLKPLNVKFFKHVFKCKYVKRYGPNSKKSFFFPSSSFMSRICLLYLTRQDSSHELHMHQLVKLPGKWNMTLKNKLKFCANYAIPWWANES